jgi:hypothetical protein
MLCAKVTKEWKWCILLRPKRSLFTTAQCQTTATLEDEHNIVKSFVPSLKIPRVPLPNFVWDESCRNHGEKIALVIKFLQNDYCRR